MAILWYNELHLTFEKCHVLKTNLLIYVHTLYLPKIIMAEDAGALLQAIEEYETQVIETVYYWLGQSLINYWNI